VEKILIIEDNTALIEDLARILENENYEVHTATNGSDGIKMAKKIEPNLIICDIMMPEVDGYSVLKEVKNIPSLMFTPFLFLTAKTGEDNLRYGMNLGADDYISKPYKNEQLIQAVKARITKNKQIKGYFDNKIESVQKFIASSMPHELRTPLSSIFGFTQILQHNLLDLSNKEISIMLDGIFDSAMRLLRLIVNFTYYSKLINVNESNKDQNTIDSSDFIIRSTSANIATTYHRNNDLLMNLNNAPIAIPQEYFNKIIEEMVDNAFKFSEINSEVKISSQVSNNNFIMAITNMGLGMTEEQITSIGAFIQFDRRQYEQQGCGLGLAIVKKILDLYKGRMEITSIPGEKITFVIFLPITFK
jgi:two-component system, sensor histidine kinase and response regulator